ncbi:MAG: hypothetical protein Q7U74_07330, partial [Saprospiraceae bacterium]|nr:hypothetical protein [Saprospiraceae bacterium]
MAAVLTGCLAATASPTQTPTPLALPTTTPTDSPPPPKGAGCRNEKAELLLPTPAARQSQNKPPVSPKVTPELANLSQRAGFGMAIAVEPEAWASELRAGWYWSWSVKLRGPNQLPEHWQTIRLQTDCFYPSEAYIRWVASHYPGSVWMIGNEP